MKSFNVLWLGPKLKQAYEATLRSPANWRMITQLAALDEKAEAEAQLAKNSDPPERPHPKK